MAAQKVCSLSHTLISKCSALEIKDNPLQVLPCWCGSEANFRGPEVHDVIVRCVDVQMGSFQLGLRIMFLGNAWDSERLKARRFHILAGVILERPTFKIVPAQFRGVSELRPFGSPGQYFKLDFRRQAILHAALIPSFNLDILTAMANAKAEGFHEFDLPVQQELVNASCLMSQFARVFQMLASSDEHLKSGHGRDKMLKILKSKYTGYTKEELIYVLDHCLACSSKHEDELLSIGEDLIQEVNQTMEQSKSIHVDRRTHKFLSNVTRAKSEYHQTTWFSVDGKCCWIDAPFDRNAVWEVVDVVRIQYKPASDCSCHDGRLIVEARTANVEIKHPFPTAIRESRTMDLPAGRGVRLRVLHLMEINFRSYATDSQSVQADMGMLPSDTSRLSAHP